MAPQWGPVNFGPEPKTPQIRNKIKILSFILCLTTVTIYRTKPSSEMTAHQGPSNIYNTTPNALPRDIRVRGSKPVIQHYRNPSMEHRSVKTHNQSSNTEKHHTHPRNNEDTITQQTPGTQNYYSPKLLLKGTEINISPASHTNIPKIYTNHTEETNKTDPTPGNHKNFQLIHIPEEPAKKITQKHSTKHKQIQPQHETLILPLSGVFSAPQSFRVSRHFYIYPDQSQTTSVTLKIDQSQTTGGTPTAHFANVITVSPATMLSSYPDRFTATASALNEHYPTVQPYLVDFSTLTARCTQQGLLINRIQFNLNTFAGVDQLINVAQFELPEETTNLTDLFHSAFDLPQEERNVRLEELFEQDEAFLTSMNINSNELTNRHRAIVDIIAQLDQAITLSEGLHDTTIACMAEGVTLVSVLPGNRDGVESWTQSIQSFDILLQESGTALCALHHKCSMAALEMLTCLSSMATYPNIVQWRRMEFSRKRDENHRNNRNWVQRERMNPNANHWHLASPTDIANLKRQGAANRQGNRGQNPSAPLEPFHGLPVPYLAIAPHANPTQLDHFVPANPAFDFARIVKIKGAGWLHRAYVGKDIPVKVTWYGWPSDMDDRQITTLIYSLGLPILSSPVFPRKKGAIPLCSLVYKTMTNGLWDCLSRRGGFINDVPIAIKVAVGTKDTTLGAYHIWATLSGSGHTFAPREYPHAFQTWVYQRLGIQLLISPQTLLPNWLTAACHNGRWELALQNPADIQQLVKLLDLPLLLEELTGRGTIDPANLLIGKLRLKEGQGRYVLELICLPSGVDQGTLERFLGQQEIDYSGLQARPNSGNTVTWTIGFDNNLLRTEASKKLGNAIVAHLSNRPLRINVKQLTMPRGMCNICFHESNSLDNMRHMWRECPNRNYVCTVCHKDSHTTNECGYVDALVEYEPETQNSVRQDGGQV